MLSNKPMRVRLAFSVVVILSLFGILYLEEWIFFWIPNTIDGAIWIFSALIGGWIWALTIPHPRQERKRREALLKAQGEKDRKELLGETLAEKRP